MEPSETPEGARRAARREEHRKRIMSEYVENDLKDKNVKSSAGGDKP